jgi:hypothetical protein
VEKIRLCLDDQMGGALPAIDKGVVGSSLRGRVAKRVGPSTGERRCAAFSCRTELAD